MRTLHIKIYAMQPTIPRGDLTATNTFIREKKHSKWTKHSTKEGLKHTNQ